MRRIYIDKRSIPLFLLSVFIIVTLIGVNFGVLHNKTRENLIATRENQVLQGVAQVNYYFQESKDSVKRAAYTISMMQERGASDAEILQFLEQESDVYTQTVNKDFTGFYGSFNGHYLDGIGWVPDADYVAEERPWYMDALDAQGEIALVSPYLDSQTGTVMMSISQLLQDGTSVVSLDLSMDGLQTLAEECAVQFVWNDALILDQDGFVVAHSDRDELGKVYDEETDGIGCLIAAELNSTPEEQERAYFEVDYAGKSYFVFSSALNDGWHALAIVDENRLFGSLRWIYVIFFVTLLVIIAVIAYVFLKIQQKQGQTEDLNRQIQAVANIYAAVRLIDLKEDSFTMINGRDEDMQMLLSNKHMHAQNALRVTMDAMTDIRFKKAIFDFTNFSTLQERLSDKNTIIREYIDINNDRCRARFVPVEYDETGTLHYVMWMVEITDNRSA
ncbi:MAG: hypothetical protein IJ747_00645 [Lachnospiraceae bacterium]|nr:hypothetical protein [Lachnospiraceae bacterium]